jgi:hypothetical protein
MCRPYGTRVIDLSLPGTTVPGYRLFRPYGTGSVAASSSFGQNRIDILTVDLAFGQR